jgi:Cu-Zn family superoxide dismutase
MGTQAFGTRVRASAAIGAILAFALIGCINDDDKSSGPAAKATLATTGAGAARGSVHFTMTGAGVRVQASFQGLPPGVHGFHIHDKGSCDSAGNAAGGHFNPLASQHGMPDSAMHHMGDLGNLTAGADSAATIDRVFPYLALEGANTLIGHAVIVHALPDNGSQPTGAAGARISCGVVTAGK